MWKARRKIRERAAHKARLLAQLVSQVRVKTVVAVLGNHDWSYLVR